MFQPPYAECDIPTAVAGRLDRPTALFDPARRFEFLITEGALRLRLGPRSMMAAQLGRIAALSTLDNVAVGLIPADAPALTLVNHGFVILEGADDTPDPLVLVETAHAVMTINAVDTAALYRKQWSLLRHSALFDAGARDLLALLTFGLQGPHGLGWEPDRS